jgi:hypothetical protein
MVYAYHDTLGGELTTSFYCHFENHPARDYEELQASVRILPPIQLQDEAAQPLGCGVLSLGTLDFID